MFCNNKCKLNKKKTKCFRNLDISSSKDLYIPGNGKTGSGYCLNYIKWILPIWTEKDRIKTEDDTGCEVELIDGKLIVGDKKINK